MDLSASGSCKGGATVSPVFENLNLGCYHAEGITGNPIILAVLNGVMLQFKIYKNQRTLEGILETMGFDEFAAGIEGRQRRNSPFPNNIVEDVLVFLCDWVVV